MVASRISLIYGTSSVSCRPFLSSLAFHDFSSFSYGLILSFCNNIYKNVFVQFGLMLLSLFLSFVFAFEYEYALGDTNETKQIPRKSSL